MEQWSETHSTLDRMLDLERALARHQRQQWRRNQWQRFVLGCQRLHTSLTHVLAGRQWQRTFSSHS